MINPQTQRQDVGQKLSLLVWCRLNPSYAVSTRAQVCRQKTYFVEPLTVSVNFEMRLSAITSGSDGSLSLSSDLSVDLATTFLNKNIADM